MNGVIFIFAGTSTDSPNSSAQSKKLKLIEQYDHILAEKLQAEENSKAMDSSEEYEDSGNESSGEDVEFAMEREERGSAERNPDEEYNFTVLTTENIVQHMVDCIREVNQIMYQKIRPKRCNLVWLLCRFVVV